MNAQTKRLSWRAATRLVGTSVSFCAVLWSLGTLAGGTRHPDNLRLRHSYRTHVSATEHQKKPTLEAPLTAQQHHLYRYESLSNHGRELLETGDSRSALETYRKALRLSRELGNPSLEASAEFGIAQAQRYLGNLQDSLKASERAICLTERAAEPRQSAQSRTMYSFVIDLMMEVHSDAKAFEITEIARTMRHSSRLAEAKTISGCQAASSTPSITREVQELLDGDTLLLSFWLGDERSFLWVIGKDSIASHVLPSQAQIEGRAVQLRTVLRASDRRVAQGSSALALEAMSQLILNPAAGDLKSKRLAIIPDGELQSIPFAALPNPSQSSKPLLQDHEIVMLPSASALDSLRRETEKRPTPAGFLAVIGDPVFGVNDPRFSASFTPFAGLPENSSSISLAQELPRLPYSGIEAAEILRLAPTSNDNLNISGFDATREVATSGTLSGYQILHFATHAVVDTRYTGESGILLSTVDREGRSKDGFLRSSDIQKMQLSADLVVLNACQTGWDQDSGQGRQTLLSSFLDAGASRVIASLWEVEDRASAELMKRFYQRLLGQGLEPADALRQAQISMMNEPRWSSPFYWAGFILEGDWRPK